MDDQELDHPCTRAELQSAISRLTPDNFVARHVLDRVPHIFANRLQYLEWRIELGADLSVDPHNIVVVGSSAVGFSMTPEKDLSPVHAQSDIDTAVISAYHFETAWRVLRDFGPVDLLGAGSPERKLVKYHREKLLYDGSIAAERLLNHLPFGPVWAGGLARAAARDPTIGREVKARIYKDFESLRAYQTSSARQVKARLLTEETKIGES